MLFKYDKWRLLARDPDLYVQENKVYQFNTTIKSVSWETWITSEILYTFCEWVQPYMHVIVSTAPLQISYGTGWECQKIACALVCSSGWQLFTNGGPPLIIQLLLWAADPWLLFQPICLEGSSLTHPPSPQPLFTIVTRKDVKQGLGMAKLQNYSPT